MRSVLFAVSAAVIMAACNTTPKAPEATKPATPTDTTYMMGQESPVVKPEQTPEPQAAPLAEKKTTTAHKSSSHSGTSSSASSTSGSSSSGGSTAGTSSGSGSTASKKKGWSKTAKGAVIGGAVGAGAGAVINKKNRAAGAVIGGILGAGTGAVIGNQMDKKDGRH